MLWPRFGAACDGAFTATGEGVEKVRYLKHAMERRGRAMQMGCSGAILVQLYQSLGAIFLKDFRIRYVRNPVHHSYSPSNYYTRG